MKFFLFDKIRIGDIEGSNRFFTEYFVHILEKIYFTKLEYENKHATFVQILSYSNFLYSYDYLIKSEQVFQSFTQGFEKSLYGYLIKTKYIDENCYSDFEDELVKKINIHISYKNDQSSNYFNNKGYIPKTLERIKDEIPLIKKFNPSYTNKTIINKKILRKFKNFLKDNFHSLIKDDIDIIFWNKFIKENLLPPMKYVENLECEIEFRSFNLKYMMWLFNKDGAKYLYEKFLLLLGNQTVINISKDYSLKDNEIEDLKFYLFHIGESFGNKANKEAPVNAYENEKILRMYDDYIGGNFDTQTKNDLFSLCCNEKDYKRNLERNSKELDYILFDNLIKSNSSSDKEE